MVSSRAYSIFDREHDTVFVKTDNDGIETVYRFLKEKGFIDKEDASITDESNGGAETIDIRESRILVSGGGGMAGSFDSLKPLAQALGAQVSASRRLVDSGIAPRRIQVGQSGKTVNCELYIAIGIYGAFQHVIGIKKVKYLITVNRNRLAPISSLADIAVEGDTVEFIEKMTARLTADRQ